MQSEQFKKAVGKFPTGVCVITTSNSDKLWGFTANSFVSVSLSPPLISFCLNTNAASLEAFKNSKFFVVNILSSAQETIAKNFSQPAKDKFANINYKIDHHTQSPYLVDSASILFCSKKEQIICGDHYIFIGEVKDTKIDENKNPLLYFARSFREIK